VDPTAPAAVTARDGPRGDVVSALVNLGYPPAAVDKAIDAVVKDAPADVSFEDLLRRALRQLSR